MQRAYDVVKKLLVLVFLYSASQWLIVNSPFEKPVSVTESAGTVFAATTLALMIFSCGSIVFWIFLRGEKRRYVRESELAIGGVTLVFALSLWLVTTSSSIKRPVFGPDSGGIVLTAASLALFIFSTLIAVAALVGWPNFEKYVKLKVQEAVGVPFTDIQKSIDTTLKEVRNELRGRSLSTAGVQLGELSLGKDSLQVERRDLFDSAVESCRRGFRELENAAPGPRLMALNNWLYYSTFQKRPLTELTEEQALKYARELEKVGRENKATHLQLTYGRVVARRISSLEERASAKYLLNDLIPELSASARKEAQDCIRLLSFDDPRVAE